MSKPRIALVGVGRMGTGHLISLALSRKLSLCALCDIDGAIAERKSRKKGIPGYTDYKEMMDREQPDALIVATPHYDHTPIAIEAMERGIHVLVEKPVAVHALDVRKMIAAHDRALKKSPGLIFAAMFQMRTQPHWIRVKEMIDSGALGSLMRASWIITDWYRNQAYYDQGGWRATWRGEGGGVLMNQAVHNLDLYQWLFGMPCSVNGFASMGKYHDIEVEDEVTGYFEHENGMVGHFITSTAEHPGSNRLEIVGDKGSLIIRKQKILFRKNKEPLSRHTRRAVNTASTPRWRRKRIYTRPRYALHESVISNFADAIGGDAPLVAPAREGLNSIQLSNALLQSSFLGKTVHLPMDERAYAEMLQKLIDESKHIKKVRDVEVDLGWSKGRSL